MLLEPTLIDNKTYPTRRPDVTAIPVEAEWVLFDETNDHILAINPSAGVIWQMCDGQRTVEAIIQSLAEQFDRPAEHMRVDVNAVIEDLQAHGLLECISSPVASSVTADHVIHVGFEGHYITVSAEEKAITDWLSEQYRALLTEPAGKQAGHIHAQTVDNNQYSLTGVKEMQVESASFDETIRNIRYEVVLQLVEARPDLLWMHAGAAAYEDKGVLAIGEWGSGKSTLVSTLHKQGWHYLSDDVVPYDPLSGNMMAYPQTPMIRTSQQKRLPQDQVAGLSKSRVTLNPSRIAHTPIQPHVIVFPVFRPDEPAALVPCSPATAVVTMAKQGLNVKNNPAFSLRCLTEMVSHLPTFQLFYRTGEEAAGLIAESMASTGN